MEPSILMNLTRGRIVHMLVAHGPATAPDIATALCLNKATVSRALGMLSEAGIIRRTDTTIEDTPLTYAVDHPQVLQEIAQARLFFAPWL
ncbi:MarR family transcriptional regulator [Arthrobacter sp. TWP1-1]|uniref:MarR family transcriptional regulator n=1 Tax=Arthrobacter sp. TWP1-1 TaxID=2804568 RepID=UPI003CF8A233